MSILSITGVSVAVSAPLPDLGFFPSVGLGPALGLAELFLGADFLDADFLAPFGADFLDDFEDFFLAISRFRIRCTAFQVNKIPRFQGYLKRRKTPEICLIRA